MSDQLLAFLGNAGPMGAFIAYLMWREKIGAEKRGDIEKARAEADKALASALAALTVTIQFLEQKIK